MSDTPETDEEHRRLLSLECGNNRTAWEGAFLCMLRHAEKLERKLAAANAENARLRGALPVFQTAGKEKLHVEHRTNAYSDVCNTHGIPLFSCSLGSANERAEELCRVINASIDQAIAAEKSQKNGETDGEKMGNNG